MKALVYHGPGRKAWEEVPDPVIVHPNALGEARMAALAMAALERL